MKGVELYGRVRYAVQVEGLSHREAARRFGIDPRTVAKMMVFSVPPGYRRSREGQHLRYRPRIQPEPPSRLTTAQTLNPHRMADLPVKFHALHPPALRTPCKELSAEAILLRRNQKLWPLQ